MSLWKRHLRDGWLGRVGVPMLAAGWLRLCHATTRWERVGLPLIEPYWAEGQPVILALWHGRLGVGALLWQGATPLHMLVSAHGDGRLIARTVERLGVRTVAGSSRRGGARAARDLVRLLQEGQAIGVTPDGPRGPRMRVQPGVIDLARLSGAPIVPVAMARRHRRQFASWDCFQLPLPFGRGMAAVGRPLLVPADVSEAGREGLREELENRLNALTAAVDQRLGVPPVRPADGETH